MKLKQCPFCNSKARFTQYLDIESGKFQIAIVCTNKDCQARSGYSTNRAEIVRAWNRRVNE